MKLNTATDLGQLAELMGTDATKEEAALLLNYLFSRGVIDTDHLTEAEWRNALDAALS